ncbi:hypothetical protein P7K49_006245, partial [Saguinus oedipus]
MDPKDLERRVPGRQGFLHSPRHRGGGRPGVPTSRRPQSAGVGGVGRAASPPLLPPPTPSPRSPLPLPFLCRAAQRARPLGVVTSRVESAAAAAAAGESDALAPPRSKPIPGRLWVHGPAAGVSRSRRARSRRPARDVTI